jgi:protein-S-isoprenylcysteine O-methyltransferase Ste14
VSAWRQARAIALLPGTVAVVLPAIILIAGSGSEIGQGTLAPWDPTGHLVAEGPYAHVRNPMISAVLAALLGEAAVFGSPGILILAGAFVVVNHGYLLLHEEPGLERRFGDEYREYKRAVPRWIPRSRPWAATR